MKKKLKTKKRFKFLTISLIVSITANISLMTLFFYQSLKEKKQSKIFELRSLSLEKTKQQENDLAECIDSFSKISFRELVTLLGSKEHIEEGYKIRDVALACLVKYHHFHLGKALSEQIQKRSFLFSKEGKSAEKILFFPGLSDRQFDAILHYAYTEKWPLTSQGLFLLLKAWPEPLDESLMTAFYHTKEFDYIASLFKGARVNNSDLLKMLLDGNFPLIKTFIKDNKEKSEYTFRKLLLTYIFYNSPTACKLLLQTDFLYAVKKLDDQMILTLLTLIEERTEDLEQFCFELIKSSRTNEVWMKSASILYAMAGEFISSPYDHKQTLQRFVFSKHLKEKWSESKKEAPIADSLFGSEGTRYLVKEGDTLWYIARRFKVDIDHLIEYNQLASDKIYPGIEIEIPEE